MLPSSTPTPRCIGYRQRRCRPTVPWSCSRRAGMPGYEAKAYLALLTAGEPMNGYEVAKVSGVPRSTVYETLGKLVARGAVFEVAATNGRVSPTSPCPPTP